MARGGGGGRFLIIESLKVCFIASVRITDVLNDLAKQVRQGTYIIV